MALEDVIGSFFIHRDIQNANLKDQCFYENVNIPGEKALCRDLVRYLVRYLVGYLVSSQGGRLSYTCRAPVWVGSSLSVL